MLFVVGGWLASEEAVQSDKFYIYTTRMYAIRLVLDWHSELAKTNEI